MADETAQGINAFGALADQNRKHLAYNALVRAYGPEAADPEAWGRTQDALKKEAELPYAGPMAEANVADTKARARLVGAQADTSAALLPGAPDAQAAETSERKASAANQTAAAQKTTQDAANAKLTSIAGIAAAALKGDPKTDPGALFDTLAPSIKGVHPDINDDHIKQMRQSFVNDPQGTLASILNPTPKVEAGTVNGQPGFVAQNALGQVSPADATGGVAPAAPIEGAGEPFVQGGQWSTQYHRKDGSVVNVPLPKGAEPQTAYDAEQLRKLGYVRLTGEAPAGGVPGAAPAPAPAAKPGEGPPVPGTGDKRAIPADSRYARLVTQKDKDSANDMAKATVNLTDGVAQAAPILQQVLEQITPYTTGPGVALKELPGTVQDNLKRNLETLKANEFLTVLNGMKNKSGQSGIGRVLQSEVPMMQAAYGNMQQDQTTKQLAQHVELLRQFLDRSKDKATAAFKSAYGADAYDVMGVKPYAPNMTTPATGAAARPSPDEAKAELARRRAAAAGN